VGIIENTFLMRIIEPTWRDVTEKLTQLHYENIYICIYDLIKEYEAGGRQGIPTKFYSENLKTRDRLGDLGIFQKRFYNGS
jgi:hypothetical protein